MRLIIFLVVMVVAIQSMAMAMSPNGRTYYQMTREYHDKLFSDRDFIASDDNPEVGIVVYRTYEKIAFGCDGEGCSEVVQSDAIDVIDDGVLKLDEQKSLIYKPEVLMDVNVEVFK